MGTNWFGDLLGAVKDGFNTYTTWDTNNKDRKAQVEIAKAQAEASKWDEFRDYFKDDDGTANYQKISLMIAGAGLLIALATFLLRRK